MPVWVAASHCPLAGIWVIHFRTPQLKRARPLRECELPPPKRRRKSSRFLAAGRTEYVTMSTPQSRTSSALFAGLFWWFGPAPMTARALDDLRGGPERGWNAAVIEDALKAAAQADSAAAFQAAAWLEPLAPTLPMIAPDHPGFLDESAFVPADFRPALLRPSGSQRSVERSTLLSLGGMAAVLTGAGARRRRRRSSPGRRRTAVSGHQQKKPRPPW